MFTLATAFNRDISKWDVLSVATMGYMFLDASSFDQKLCGIDWIHSKASKPEMFTGSSGSISRIACTSAPTLTTNQAPRQHASRRPMPERELIGRTPLSTTSVTSASYRTITCPRCGTFRKSGRVSCCAPGGAWFKNCGGLGSKDVGHRWSDGVKACKRKFKAKSM